MTLEVNRTGRRGRAHVLSGAIALAVLLSAALPAWSAGAPAAGKAAAAKAKKAKKKNVLAAGKRLRPGKSLRSPNRDHRLQMRRDGNLVLRSRAGRIAWESQTAGSPGAYARLSRRGDLTVFSEGRELLWTTGTEGGRRSRLVVRNAGDAVLLSRRGGDALWNAKEAITSLPPGDWLGPGDYRRSSNADYFIDMQADGNLVLRDAGGRARWSSQTHGNPGAYAYMQPEDGNLVIFSSARTPLWQSRTAGNPGAFLKLGDDGNLAIYSTAGQPLWDTSIALSALARGSGSTRASTGGRPTRSTSSTCRRTATWCSAMRAVGLGGHRRPTATPAPTPTWGRTTATWSSTRARASHCGRPARPATPERS